MTENIKLEPEITVPLDPKGTIDPDINSNSEPGAASNTNQGQTVVQVNDDKINVTDTSTPIVLLFGPRGCGKTMSLVRLSRYLYKCGYAITTDKLFRYGDDYQKKCEEFERNLSTDVALAGNGLKDFLMVKMYRNGTPVCQFLEAPGEDYFDPESINVDGMPPYMTEIVRRLPNRKIWAFMTEPDWVVEMSTRSSYIKRIQNFLNQIISPQDSKIIIYNKVDKQAHLFKNGRPIKGKAQQDMSMQYNGLVDLFKNNNPITSLWHPYNHSFVAFSTGSYPIGSDGSTKIYVESKDSYPAELWDTIMGHIKG